MTPDKPGDGSVADVADVDVRLGALRARTRREILALIWGRELPAGDIAAAFSLTPATISEHLAVLRSAGLVDVTRVGTSRRYRARRDALAGLHGALEGATKWQAVEDIPERAHTVTRTQLAVISSVIVPTVPDVTFAAFTDPATFSRWLQVPVTIDDGRFAATLEWGTEVRGRYDFSVPPHLLVMSWDFDDDNVPVPGRPLTAYLRIESHPDGSHVEVHQLTETSQQAAFMTAAWGMVLGRLAANITGVVDATAAPPRRTRRPKDDARQSLRSGRPAGPRTS